MTRSRATHAGQHAMALLSAVVPTELVRLARLRSAWRQLVTEPLCNHVHPASLYGGTLVLHVLDNQWLHEFGYLRADLWARIQQLRPDLRIFKLRVRVGDLPRASANDTSEAPRTATKFDVEPCSEFVEALGCVQNATLRHTIATARQALCNLSQRR